MPIEWGGHYSVMCVTAYDNFMLTEWHRHYSVTCDGHMTLLCRVNGAVIAV